MAHHRYRTTRWLALALASASAGCGVTSLQSTLGGITGSTAVDAQPVDAYTRIAKGALSCWFGPTRGLKATHVFHADVAPPATGNSAEIVIHEKDASQPGPRALRAYRVAIVGSGAGSTVIAENLRLPPLVGQTMTADVARWAAGQDGCPEVPTEPQAATAAAARPTAPLPAGTESAGAPVTKPNGK